MPPKVKITKEDIIRTAVDIVRQNGAEAVNARAIAEKMNCSTQPVFSNFATMEELRSAVLDAAQVCYRAYAEREIGSGAYPTYKAIGMAYIRFAKEERELFKLLYMRDRSHEMIPSETEETKRLADIVRENTGIDGDAANLFHLEMWAYIHGIAAMIVTDYLNLDTELISRMLTDVYQGLKKRYETKE